jgi:hypothetical protein
MSQTWCPEIYRNVFIDRVNDDRIRIAPCCQAGSAIEVVDTFDFQTSAHLTKLRKQFDCNERPVECSTCWTDEQIEGKSLRIDEYNESVDIVNPKITRLVLKLTNHFAFEPPTYYTSIL